MKMEKHIYYFLNTLLLAFIILTLFYDKLGIVEITHRHGLAILYAGTALCGVRFFGGKGKIFWSIAFCALTCMLLFSVSGSGIEEFIGSYIRWIFAKGGWNLEWEAAFEILNLLWVTALVFLFCYLSEKYFALKGITACILLLYFIISMFTQKEISHTGAVLGITYLLLIYTEGCQKTENKVRSNSGRFSLLWLLPFIGIYLVFMLMLPAPKDAYDWKPAKSIYHNLKEGIIVLTQNISRIGSVEDFNVSFAGFSSDGKLAGDIYNSDKEVMTIQTNADLKTNIYLTGKVFDTFADNEWIQTDLSTGKEQELDTLETLYAVNRQTPLHQQDYIMNTDLLVRYGYFDTGYLFAPLKSSFIKNEDQKLNYSRQGGNYVFEKKKGYGTEYKVQYYQINLNRTEFYEMMMEQQLYTYGLHSRNEDLLNSIKKRYFSQSKSMQSVTEESFAFHAAAIEEVYNKPYAISPKVKAYLNEITKTANTDVEKLIAIESALSKLTYTLTPGDIPDNQDFLEYFLLEKKEGYCSYFATAFVLLAREADIPARYVQGFCVPVNQETGAVSVTSKMAHAWPEAYINGVGWIPFEPTPGYQKIRYTPWEISTDKAPKIYGSPISDGYIDPEALSEEAAVSEQKESNSGAWKIFLYPILAVLAASACFLLLDTAVLKQKYKKMSPEEKVRADCISCLNILSVMGYTMKDGETLSELRLRIMEYLESTGISLDFIGSYEEVRYGNREITSALISEIREERKRLLDLLKAQKGKKYILYRIRLYFYRGRSL